MRGLPKCRTKDIIIKQLDGETLIYDLKTHEATCLNEAASAIYKDCDGSLSIEDLCETTRRVRNDHCLGQVP